jgi:hypothetical protein
MGSRNPRLTYTIRARLQALGQAFTATWVECRPAIRFAISRGIQN